MTMTPKPWISFRSATPASPRWNGSSVARRSRSSCLKGGCETRGLAEKRAWIRDHRPEGVTVERGCELMEVARSSFYADWRCARDDGAILARITAICGENWNGGYAMTDESVLQIESLSKRFCTRAGHSRTNRQQAWREYRALDGACGRQCRPEHPARGNSGPRRRIWLRQIHPWPHCGRVESPDRGAHPLSGARCRIDEGGRCA